MNWFYVFLPIAGVHVWWPGLVILGLGVGVIGGFFGMGGAWMVTPALNVLGFPMAFAIGTDITHMAGKSLISTMRHAKFGNVDYKLSLIMVFGTVGGLEIGARNIMWLERIGKIDLYVRCGYLVLLTGIAWLVFADVWKRWNKDRAAIAAGRQVDHLATGIEWYKTLQRIKIPPVVNFPKAGIRCSVWLPIAVAFFTGWLAGVLGIGGGLIRMPSLIYLIGCPTHVAVGTDLFEIAVSGLYGAATYSYKGRVELGAALIMLVGAAVGAQIGAVATKYVKGYGIRIFFGWAVIGCDISVLMKIIAAARPQFKAVLDIAATVLILGLVSLLSLVIVMKFILGVRRELALKKVSAVAALAASMAITGCGHLGKVDQGRVIAYDRQKHQVTLIREPGILPPVTLETPADPKEMGPAPKAGGLLLVDSKNHRLVIYDRASHSLRTVVYAPLAERRNVAKSPGPPVVDRIGKTITIYAPKDRILITFAASDDLLQLPAESWRAGDVVRYYYKDPARALRFMNVTQTDLSKATG